MRKFIVTALVALAGIFAMPSVASAQLPPNADWWGTGNYTGWAPCNDNRYLSSSTLVYGGFAPGGAFQHFTSVSGRNGQALESNETRCLANGITLRVRFWIADLNPPRYGCKYWGDTINNSATSGLTPEWCGYF